MILLARWETGFWELTFKDTHQSNLDDIERQELEEQEVEVIK